MLPAQIAIARRKWRRWMKRIAAHVGQLVDDDYFFRECMDAAKQGGHIAPSNEVYQLFIRMYAVHASIGVRRVLDRGKKTYSLIVLLEKIAANPQLLSRTSFVSCYGKLRDLGEKDYDSLAGTNATHLPPTFATDLIARLKAAERNLAPVTDKEIAHRERKKWIGRRGSYAELHAALKEIDAVACRLNFLLNQDGRNSLRAGNITEFQEDCWVVWAGRKGRTPPLATHGPNLTGAVDRPLARARSVRLRRSH